MRVRALAAMLALLAVALGVRAATLPWFDGNWDEFFYLAQVHDAAAGRLTKLLQMGHVHLFGWLTGIEGTALDRVVAGRAIALACGLVTLALLFGVARRFLTAEGALFAVLAYAAFGFVAEHAASFRADPFATVLLVGAGWLLACRAGAGTAAAAGVAVALATFVTIKSVLLFPALGVLLLERMARCAETGGRRAALVQAAVCVGASALALAVLLALHAQTLVADPLASAGGTLGRSASRTLLDAGLLPSWPVLRHALALNPAFWACLLGGLALVAAGAWRGDAGRGGAGRRRDLVLLGLATPLLCLLVYRNAFPYFYVFLLPFPALLCGRLIEALPWRRAPGRAQLALALGLMGLALGLWATVERNAARTQAVQRAILEGVGAVFPEPVPYLDRNSMVASFPKQGPFLSSWGLAGYHETPGPVFARLIAETQPVFLLANHPALAAALDPAAELPPPHGLKPADAAALRSAFVPHWGPLWVAGASVRVDGTPRGLEIAVGGTYTLEAEAPVSIGGRVVAPGEQVFLNAGRHTVLSETGAPVQAVLRWGTNLARPAAPPPEGPIYFGF